MMSRQLDLPGRFRWILLFATLASSFGQMQLIAGNPFDNDDEVDIRLQLHRSYDDNDDDDDNEKLLSRC